MINETENKIQEKEGPCQWEGGWPIAIRENSLCILENKCPFYNEPSKSALYQPLRSNVIFLFL